MIGKASPQLLQQWKAATRLAIQDAGGLDVASGITGLSTTQLSRCQAAHAPDILSIAATLALAEFTGCNHFAQVLAALSGHRIVAIATDPPLEGVSSPAVQAAGSVAAYFALISESAEVQHVAAEALSDGVVTPAEQQRILRAAADLQEAMAPIQRATGRVVKRERM